MLKRYLKNSLYFTVTGAIAVCIMKDEKILNYSANIIEKFSSRYVQKFDDPYLIDDEITDLNSLVIRILKFLNKLRNNLY